MKIELKEKEKAENSEENAYLPINLAKNIFHLSKNDSFFNYFVKYHCTQILINKKTMDY